MSEKSEFVIAKVLPGTLNALVKNIMKQTGTNDPNEAVRLVNSGEWIVSKCENIIDCSAPVFVPDGWSVLPDSEQLPNRVLGQFKFDPTKIRLHLDEGQKNGKFTRGEKLHEALKDQKVLTAHVLDFLLKKENWHLIPEEWKGKYIFFWGTVYRHTRDRSCVRFLDWSDGRWSWFYYWIDDVWLDGDPAACAQ